MLNKFNTKLTKHISDEKRLFMRLIGIAIATVFIVCLGQAISTKPVGAQGSTSCMTRSVYETLQQQSPSTCGPPEEFIVHSTVIDDHGIPLVPAPPIDITFTGGRITWWGIYAYGTSVVASYNTTPCYATQISMQFSQEMQNVTLNIHKGYYYNAGDPPVLLTATDNLGRTQQVKMYGYALVTLQGGGIRTITISTANIPFYVDDFSFTPECSVTSMEWAALNSSLDPNPNLGAGQRMFPDRQSATDAIDRRIVRARATSNLGANVSVYFRAFDVDDPSTDAPPVDANSSAGNDNRGIPQAGTLSATLAQTDANGIAQVDFTVTMQPGDNFLIAASNDQAYLNGLVIDGTNLRDSNNILLPTSKAKATPLLTVWRRLNIEVDSMGLVAGNQVTGRTSSVTPNMAANQTTIAASTTLEANRFQNGRIILNNVGSFSIVSNATNNVTVQGIITSVPHNTNYTLYDDDDFNSNDGVALRGDASEDVDAIQPTNMFDTTFRLAQESDSPNLNAFAPAYIRPSYDWARNGGYDASSVTFKLNVTNTATAIDTQLNLGRNSANSESSSFWVVYIQLGYQHAADRDNDPAGEPAGATTGTGGSWTGGIDTYSGSGTIPQGTDGSLVYIEVQRDVELSNGIVRLIRTVPHEIGHQFGLKGDDAGNAYGVMSYGNDVQFVPDHLNILRWRVSSPGKP